MRTLALRLLVAVAALVFVPVALGDGQPIPVMQGGTGVASHINGLHYVTVSDRPHGTLLETFDAANGVFGGARLHGSWGIPTIGNGNSTGQGLSHDGRTLVLEPLSGPYVSPSRFLVVDTRRMKPIRRITLDGSFSFDALSPDASRMYLIQYTSANDLSHYIVRGYDMRTNRLLPGRIVARSDDGDEKSMAGSPMTRTTSSDGRWVYTLYQKPSGAPFVHALDTMRGVAYCIDLPANRALYNIVLSLRNNDRTLAVHWRSGRPWLRVAVGSWRISDASSGFPWAWLGAGIGAVLAALAAGALLLRRSRREELQQHAGEELGLA
jgi:hypothetical protein